MKQCNEKPQYYTRQLLISPHLGTIERESAEGLAITAGQDQAQTARLGPVNMHVLQTLLDNAGQVVSRGQLFERVWGNQVVSDDVLTRSISDIRSTFNQTFAESNLIETVPKKGYRWLEKVSLDSTPPDITRSSSRVSTNVINPDPGQNVMKRSIWRLNRNTFQLLVTVLISAGLFISLIVWTGNQLLGASQAAIVVLPIHHPKGQLGEIAEEVGDTLKTIITGTKGLSYFASSAVNTPASQSFYYYNQTLGANWLIEGKLRFHLGSAKLSLNLVDARTALVQDSLEHRFEAEQGVKPEAIRQVCDRFVRQVAARIGGASF